MLVADITARVREGTYGAGGPVQICAGGIQVLFSIIIYRDRGTIVLLFVGEVVLAGYSGQANRACSRVGSGSASPVHGAALLLIGVSQSAGVCVGQSLPAPAGRLAGAGGVPPAGGGGPALPPGGAGGGGAGSCGPAAGAGALPPQGPPLPAPGRAQAVHTVGANASAVVLLCVCRGAGGGGASGVCSAAGLADGLCLYLAVVVMLSAWTVRLCPRAALALTAIVVVARAPAAGARAARCGAGRWPRPPRGPRLPRGAASIAIATIVASSAAAAARGCC